MRMLAYLRGLAGSSGPSHPTIITFSSCTSPLDGGVPIFSFSSIASSFSDLAVGVILRDSEPCMGACASWGLPFKLPVSDAGGAQVESVSGDGEDIIRVIHGL